MNVSFRPRCFVNVHEFGGVKCSADESNDRVPTRAVAAVCVYTPRGVYFFAKISAGKRSFVVDAAFTCTHTFHLSNVQIPPSLRGVYTHNGKPAAAVVVRRRRRFRA